MVQCHNPCHLSRSSRHGEGLEGVTVELYRDIDGDGVYDVSEPRVASVKTNENGQYFFADLPAGNYVVKVDTSTLKAVIKAGDNNINIPLD